MTSKQELSKGMTKVTRTYSITVSFAEDQPIDVQSFINDMTSMALMCRPGASAEKRTDFYCMKLSAKKNFDPEQFVKDQTGLFHAMLGIPFNDKKEH